MLKLFASTNYDRLDKTLEPIQGAYGITLFSLRSNILYDKNQEITVTMAVSNPDYKIYDVKVLP